jgi:hypothetical protein
MESSHEHPAQPQEPEHGFDEGQETRPEDTQHVEDQEPDFARGERQGPESDAEVRPGFDAGQETRPEDAEHAEEGRFDEGQS